MSTQDDAPGAERDDARLARAADLLRERPDAGWEAVRGGLLRAATSAFRSSPPVRGRHALGEYVVASDVVVAQLRVAVEAAGPAAADRVECTTDGEDRLTGVRLDLVGAYGTPLPDLAEHVRRLVLQVLADLLGPLSALRVDVRVVDVG